MNLPFRREQGGRELLKTAMEFLWESQPDVQREQGRVPEVAASSRLVLLHNPADPGEASAHTL